MNIVFSAKILAFLPVPAKSHHIVFRPLLEELAHRGHQLTVVSPFPVEKPVSNITDIYIHTQAEDVLKTKFTFEMLEKLMSRTPIVSPLPFWFFMYDICSELFQLPKVVELIQSHENFDAVILEPFFGQESLLLFGHIFKAPVIAIQPSTTYSVINTATGNPLALSYISDIMLAYTNKMSFIERLHNTVLVMSEIFLQEFYNIPKHEEIIKSSVPRSAKSSDVPSINVMIKNISLVFINSHVCCSYPQPYVPKMIPIGGIHVRQEKKNLPNDIQTFMDEAKEGVIYFSLGSNIPDGKMPEHVRNAFVTAFSKVKQRVLWKIKVDSIPGLSNNVKLLQWAPQQDILAHPNLVLFITHGGLLSQHETINAGVPTVGIPFLGDQAMNVKYSEDAGFGVKLSYLDITAESILDRVNTVLSNSLYRENARRLQVLFRDRQSSPLDTAAYWVEYVIRYKGAPHLQTAVPHMSWIQYLSIDVIIALKVILISFLVVLYFIVKFVIRFICQLKTPKVSKLKKNK